MTWVNYANTGPWTNNSTPPGISATFLNNVESFLDQIIASAVNDSHLTADGSGNLVTVSVKGVLKSVGGGHTLTDWNAGFQAATSSGTVITHGIKNTSGVAATPTIVLVTPSIQTTFLVNALGSTTFNVQPSANCNIWWLALLL